MNTAETKTFNFIGAFTMVEAPRITEFLDNANISYEYEIDETEIKNMSIARIATHGGTAGLGCKVRLYVDADRMDEALKKLDAIFPI